MKKAFFVIFYIMLTTTMFAEHTMLLNDVVYTSEGGYAVAMFYEGINMGQKLANEQFDNPNLRFVSKLSTGQSQVIRNLLNRYQNHAGETYLLLLVFNNRHNSYDYNPSVFIIVEMTSNTEYKCWAFTEGVF